ncbi:hypothetical protein B0J18DRAFT_460608 [Chaetomium sp. MPI-SDFR-AT-0129]|nr:hypothetical protein B0J18DRAFT_460608 [Chaetomium sp. MPI-SDFR-AT-0129]
MCIAVVKHCPCVKCMDEPSPETTERLDYCADKQEMLRGTWDGNTSMPMFTRQKLMMPCHELTYMRALDANMCLFKKDNASSADTTAAAATETAVADERPLIKFTPINVPTKGHSKLANSLSNDTSGVTGTTMGKLGSDKKLDVSYLASTAQKALEFSAEKNQASKKTSDKNNKKDIGKGKGKEIDNEIDDDNVSTTTEEVVNTDADEMDIDTDNNNNPVVITSVTTTGTATNPITIPNTPRLYTFKHVHKRARLDGPSTTTKTGTALTTATALARLAQNFPDANNSPNATSSTIVHPASSTITATSSPACNYNNSSSPLAPTPSTTHGTGTGRTGSTGITNSKGRTPLPTSRPMTPRVIQATAAAAAAELAARVARGVWTHEESVKVLLLRCREIEYTSARAREVLPGRDAAACEDQLLDLALKYGYEDHI